MSIPGGWCDVGGGWNVGSSWCLILYSMMILEWRRRCCSVGRSRCWSMVVSLACLLVLILQTAHLWANTGVVFRELSFSRLECGVHDRLHIYPLCGIFYFPWHRHQIEGTNGFYCLIRKTEIFTISNVESQALDQVSFKAHFWNDTRIVQFWYTRTAQF